MPPLQAHGFFATGVCLPWLRFSLTVIALFLVARLLQGFTLAAATLAESQKAMPCQHRQFWTRRFGKEADRLCAALAALTVPPPATNFVTRDLRMLHSIGWIAAHRFCWATCGSTCWAGPRSRSRWSCDRAPPDGAARLMRFPHSFVWNGCSLQPYASGSE